jgi:hypothetical protein
MNAKLTNRDISLLLDVYKYRYLSVEQVQRLHFPSKRTTYKRLQILTNQNYLKAFTVPSIPGRVYYLDKPGAEVVAGELCVAVEELAWHRSQKSPKDYYFLRHFLAINDFRILITKACEQNPVILKGFIPEYIGDKTNTGDVKKYIRDRVCDVTNSAFAYSHTPDAVFLLEKAATPALFFLEIDRGTEVVSDQERGVLKCIKFYLNYWQEEKYRRFEKDFVCGFLSTFRVLIITTSGERIKNIRAAVTALSFPDESVKRFFWITTQARIARDGVFGNIWVSLHRDDQTVYQIG